MNHRYLTFAFLCLTTITVCAQQDPWYKRTLMKLKTFADSSVVQGVDRRYIALPDKPWRVIANTNVNEMDLRVKTKNRDLIAGNLEMNFSTHVDPPLSTSVGLWFGYRGFGLGYSISLLKQPGLNMSFNIATPKYGIGLRYRRFKTDNLKMQVELGGYRNLADPDSYVPLLKLGGEQELTSPATIQSFILDGYWAFNSKRFSIAAAYDQSMRQLRSAGSVIAGITFHQQIIDYRDISNAELIEISNGIGCVKLYQLNLGCGYTYNWVPAKGWLINFMAMPTISTLNRIKAYYFDSNYSIFANPAYGQYAKVGKKEYPDDNDLIGLLEQNNTQMLWPTGKESNYSQVHFNVDCRVAVSYWLHNYFFSVVGQYNQFQYHHDDSKVRLNDWYINASIGYTF